MATLYELKEKIATLSAARQEDAEYIAQKAADPSQSMEELEAKIAHRDELQKRLDVLQEEHDRLEAHEKAKAQQRADMSDPANKEEKKLKAAGEFFFAVMTGGDSVKARKAYEGLGGIPENSEDLGYGDNLLPTNMSNELIVEPFEENSLRKIEPVSNITGLEEPILNFSIEDEDLEDVTDKDTAREIEQSADSIAYGRFKTKLVVTVKDTVLHGTKTNLATMVQNGLRSALAIKEKMRAFDSNPDEAHAHMSFYSGKNKIKRIYGSNIIDAIIAAYADLPELFSESAVAVMRKSDYYAAIRQLANSSESLWGKKPEDVIGIPVIFNDRAKIPIVGAFSWARQNYDIGTIFETDKDAKKGEYYFIVTAWGDHRIRLCSAFRLAIVGDDPTPDTESVLAEAVITGTAKVGEQLGVNVTYSNGTAPDATLSYQWKSAKTPGASYTNIAGATDATYTPTADDVDKYLKVQVKATGSASGSALSEASAQVVAAS